MNEMPSRPNLSVPGETLSTRDTSLPLYRKSFVKRALLIIALLAGTALAGQYGYDYWITGRFLVSTDDAYVKADYMTVAPKVSGYIAEVLVQDNQAVTIGQVLARLDDRDFRTALAQSKATVAAAEAAIGNLDAQIDLQQAEIAQAIAGVAATRASLGFAELDSRRYRDLAGTGFGTVQRAQQTQTTRDQISSQLQRDEAAAVSAQRKVVVLATARTEAAAHADQARAALQQAELNLGYTTVAAAMEGTVGARTLRVGQYVAAGTELMAIVPLHAAYIVANFKETQLVDVRPGQMVQVVVDGQPDLKVSGHVDSLSPASGLEFALLPPDNATGNFTKIVQRIPVKIVFDDVIQGGYLRAGMSVEPTIDTKPSAQRTSMKTALAQTASIQWAIPQQSCLGSRSDPMIQPSLIACESGNNKGTVP